MARPRFAMTWAGEDTAAVLKARYRGADTRAKVERYLEGLDADSARVRPLAGWTWIHDALNQLPSPSMA